MSDKRIHFHSLEPDRSALRGTAILPLRTSRIPLSFLALLLTLPGCGQEQPGNSTSDPTTPQTRESAAPPTSAERHSPETAKEETDRNLQPARDAFEKLIHAQRGGDPEAWEMAWDDATAKFIALGKSATDILIEAMQAPESDKREMAVTLLAASGVDSDKANGALLQALQDEAVLVRVNAASALSHTSEHADRVTESLVRLLENDSAVVRATAVRSLGNVGMRVDVDALKRLDIIRKLIACLKDSADDVRIAAAESLGSIGPNAIDAAPALDAMQSASTGTVQAAAAGAIEKIHPKPDASPKPAGANEKK